MTTNEALDFWSFCWLFAAAGVWTLLCCLSAAGLGSVLRFAGPPTVLIATPALLGWSSRSHDLDFFVLPVLVFCAALVVTAGALRAFKRLDRARLAMRWIAGCLIAGYVTVQALACAVILFSVAMRGGERDASVGRLGDGYFFRVSTYGAVSVVWVPPLFPVVERRVDPEGPRGEKLSVERKDDEGVTRLVVLYGGEEVDRLVL